MAVVLEALVKLGYRVGWRVLDAQYFGVPQRRRRVFIVGCLGNTGPSPVEILSIGEGRAGYLEACNEKRQSTSTATATSARESRAGNFELYDFPAEPIAPTLNSSRARDTMTWWDGQEKAASLTVSSNEQRMPDKGRMQMVIVPHLEP